MPARRCQTRTQAAAFTLISISVIILMHSKLEYVTKCSDAVNPLRITSRARSAFPPDLGQPELHQCLRWRRARQGRPTRLLFVGHSRVRQLFETLTERLQLPLLTRQQLQSDGVPAAPFLDLPLPAAWRQFATGNSTCLGVWPKPPSPDSLQPAAWCSMAAFGPLVQLQFRWRHGLHSMEDALQRTEAGCSLGECPDVVVINQGLHFLAEGGPVSVRIGQYQQMLKEVFPVLQRLAARGVQIVWSLEYPGNRRAGKLSVNDESMILNTLLMESLSVTDRLHIWTSVVSSAADFWTNMCYVRMPHVSEDTFRACAEERYHVDSNTRRDIASQLLRFVCPDTDL